MTTTMPLQITENYSLRDRNTLAIDVSARYFLSLNDCDEIPAAVEFAEQQQLPFMVLGAGSNVVFAADYPGVVFNMAIPGISLVSVVAPGVDADGDNLWLDVGAGENWHQLVLYCLEQGYYGIENLALIPGTAGAAPIQNIGAYGVELHQVLASVTGYDLTKKAWRTLTAAECRLAYRDSIFKNTLKDAFIISSIRLHLHRQPNPHYGYSALAEQLKAMGIEQPTPQQVAAAVIAIRQSKLPDPAEIPNVGSFFKNPIVDESQAETLRQRFPSLVCYPQGNGRCKLAAGWLVEEAGWKGAESGHVGVHHQQSLVLVNDGEGSGAEILTLARAIQDDISSKFGVELEIEPRVYS